MNTRTRTWPRIAAALVVAAGVAVVWAALVAWSGYLISLAWRGGDRIAETVQVMADGTPVIQSSIMREPYDRTFRTLDGRPITPTREDWLTGAYLVEPLVPPGLVEMPIEWPRRVAGLSSYERPPVGWYVVRDAEPLGRAYLVGYDEHSALRIGYIVRNGFRRALPPKDEWFDLGRHQFLFWEGQALATTGNVQFGYRAYTYALPAEEQRVPPWLAFLIDGDRLLEIDLRARTLRTLYESPGLLAVATITESPAPAEEGVPPETAKRRDTFVQRIAVRTSDRIIVLDPPTGEKREFVLPESLRSRFMVAYSVGGNELLLAWGNGIYPWNPTELGWLQPDGTLSRQKTVSLMYPRPMSEEEMAWKAAPIAPVPIAWLATTAVGIPINRMQSNAATTYRDGLSQAMQPAWPALVLVIVVGVMLAGLTYRLQRKYRRPGTSAWTAFVLLLGVPGFLAYWLEQRKSNLEVCSSCRAIVPRDRDACAVCDAQFPAPPLVGTEIFA